MGEQEFVRRLNETMRRIIEVWYERTRDVQADLPPSDVEPEVKRFHDYGFHRIKFARRKEMDVTYGLGAVRMNDGVYIESSVNNKTSGFDYETFVKRLERHYWSSRNDKPWLEPELDHFTYQDLLSFEPRLGSWVVLEKRQDKADIIRLSFRVDPKCYEVLSDREDLLNDLIENYCLAPLKRIYAETYRES